MARPEQEPVEEVIIARAVIGRGDKTLITGLLKRFGLTVESMPAAEFDKQMGKVDEEKIRQSLFLGYNLDSINQRSMFVGREHFLEFWKRFSPDTPQNSVGRAFNSLIEPRSYWDIHVADHSAPGGVRRTDTPQGAESIEFALREDVNLPPYWSPTILSDNTKFLAGYAIQAGSLIDYTQENIASIENPRSNNQFVIDLSAHLELQIVRAGEG